MSGDRLGLFNSLLHFYCTEAFIWITEQTVSNVDCEGGGGSDIWWSLWRLTIVPLISHSVDPLVVVRHLGVNA